MGKKPSLCYLNSNKVILEVSSCCFLKQSRNKKGRKTCNKRHTVPVGVTYTQVRFWYYCILRRSGSGQRGLISFGSFGASHLISGCWYPPFTRVNIPFPPPSSSLPACDGVSVTASNAGLYALIIWHPLFRCAIKVPLLSSFLLLQWNNV